MTDNPQRQLWIAVGGLLRVTLMILFAIGVASGVLLAMPSATAAPTTWTMAAAYGYAAAADSSSPTAEAATLLVDGKASKHEPAASSRSELSPSSLLVAAETTTEDASLFRGVASDHPGYNDALNGVARPRGGPSTAAEHNLGDTRSEFTSRTTDPEVAKGMSYPGGIVMRIPQSSVVGRLVQSPDLFDESEILIHGPVFGAELLP